ncbi:MAG: hypothetical protein EBY84_07800 [Acidimicrobiia bacterium]|nr:hypothetical protein [Acidimicrobiia bacterium]
MMASPVNMVMARASVVCDLSPRRAEYTAHCAITQAMTKVIMSVVAATSGIATSLFSQSLINDTPSLATRVGALARKSSHIASIEPINIDAPAATKAVATNTVLVRRVGPAVRAGAVMPVAPLDSGQ